MRHYRPEQYAAMLRAPWAHPAVLAHLLRHPREATLDLQRATERAVMAAAPQLLTVIEGDKDAAPS